MNPDIFQSLSNIIFQFLFSGTTLNETCYEDANNVLGGLIELETWAMRMVDATGKFPAGILEGNVFSLGNMDECLDARADEDSDTFTGKYCLVKFKIPVDLGNWNNDLTSVWGACVPSSCTAGDLKAVLSLASPVDFETDEVLCQIREDRPYETRELLTIGILCFLTLLTILSTIHDYYTSTGHRNKYLLSFSLKTNVNNLFDTTTSHGSLKCVHGMRVVATFFIILAHVYFAEGMSQTAVNLTRWQVWVSDWTHVWFNNRSLPVDMFLVFSGMLVSYSFTNNSSKRKKFNWPLHFIHRYLRLVPAYAITLLFNATLFSRLGSGPLWKSFSQSMEKECRDNWWKYMLFINNWFVVDKCMLHTWYLGVDAQLYFLSPVLLIPLNNWPRFGLGLTFAALITAFFTSFGIAYANEERVFSYDAILTPELNISTFITYHRTTPWLIGFIVGYFLKKYQHLATPQKLEERSIRKMTLRKALLVVLTFVVFVMLFVSPILDVHPFHQPDYQYDALESATYLSLSHVMIALSVALAVIASNTRYGGLINVLFSWKFFVPLSRLTYSIYLIHVTVIQFNIASMMTPGYLSDYNMVMTAIPVALLSLILSAFLYLMVEQPAVTLERLLLRRGTPDTPALPIYKSLDRGHKKLSRELQDIDIRKDT